jgi:hypothetical protein
LATVQNLAFDLGETWIIKHTATQDGKSPFNLTNASVALYVKSSAGVVIIGPSQQTTTITDVVNGLSQITVTPAQQTAAGVTAQVASYLIRVTLQDGTITDQNWGSFTIRSTAAA